MSKNSFLDFNINMHYMGETCVLLSFGNTINPETSLLVTKIYHELKKQLNFQHLGILDIVPSYTEIAIYFNYTGILLNSDKQIYKTINELMINNESFTGELLSIKRHIHQIPTIYNGEDINFLCNLHNISKNQLIKLHCAPKYIIAMLGFKPYFPYLIGLDKRLETKRRITPKLNIPAGSVAIGGSQTGIYTENSPGGWHIIGHTTFKSFDIFRPGAV